MHTYIGIARPCIGLKDGKFGSLLSQIQKSEKLDKAFKKIFKEGNMAITMTGGTCAECGNIFSATRNISDSFEVCDSCLDAKEKREIAEWKKEREKMTIEERVFQLELEMKKHNEAMWQFQPYNMRF